jgi:hypothetical protein
VHREIKKNLLTANLSSRFSGEIQKSELTRAGQQSATQKLISFIVGERNCLGFARGSHSANFHCSRHSPPRCVCSGPDKFWTYSVLNQSHSQLLKLKHPVDVRRGSNRPARLKISEQKRKLLLECGQVSIGWRFGEIHHVGKADRRSDKIPFVANRESFACPYGFV